MAYSQLTFVVGSVLTASKMNVMDSNVDELRETEVGASRPANAVAGQFWVDTTSAQRTFNVFDGTNDIPVWLINTSANTAVFHDDVIGDSYNAESVTGEKIKSGQITAAKINSTTVVNSSHIADYAITEAKIEDGSIDGATNLAPYAFNQNVIPNGAVTIEKLSTSSWTSWSTGTFLQLVTPNYSFFPNLGEFGNGQGWVIGPAWDSTPTSEPQKYCRIDLHRVIINIQLKLEGIYLT